MTLSYVLAMEGYFQSCCHYVVFFFNDTATTEIYTLSLHDALPICARSRPGSGSARRKPRPSRAHAPRERGRFLHPILVTSDSPLAPSQADGPCVPPARTDRKSTRLNSSH